MVTMKDIAAKCGVSPATVSKALNGHSDIGAETAENIRTTAREMGYLPNSAARALKTNRSLNLGVLFVDKTSSGLAHEYFSTVLNSFKVEAERLGYDITFISKDIGNFKMDYYEHARYRNCDGVVIALVDYSDPAVSRLVESDVPVVTIDHVFNNRTAIISDNVQSMVDIVEYVYEMGHRKIAYIHGEDTLVTKKRLASFRKACMEKGIDVPDEHIRAALYHDPKSSSLATRELLSLQNRPTCILYPDDFSFLGGMSELERQGLKVPDDISVVGYDGVLLSQALRPRLTTFRQDSEGIGRRAAAKLVDEIENPKMFVPTQVLVSGSLLIGNTVKKV
ncbi:MAG: LacI family DNA-binding transcriptional regulator [Eubacteriales bacterium]